jgi:hypothetical protein
MHVTEPGDVAARVREALDKAYTNRIADVYKQDWNR